MLLPPALPDAGHVHLVPAEDVKLVIVKHVGSDAQNVWKLLLHWPERTEEERGSNTLQRNFNIINFIYPEWCAQHI